MDSLFTPEVIEQILDLLQNATDQGSTVVIVWLVLPLLAKLVIACSWLLAIHMIIKAVITALTKYSQLELDRYEAQNKPKEIRLNEITITEEVEYDLKHFLTKIVTPNSLYLRKSDLNRLKKAWTEHERTENPKENN